MPRLLNALRRSTACRRDLFDAGAGAAGYTLVDRLAHPGPGDVMLIWNRYTGLHEQAQVVEAAGGRVIVCENGYLGKAWRDRTWFAMSIGHHAGAGLWPDGGDARWDGWGVPMAGWHDGPATLVFDQRGFGEPGIAAPVGWADKTVRARGGRIRWHPGAAPAERSLDDDLADCGRCFTWNSGAALKALLAGVAVYYEHRDWIGGPGGLPLADAAAGRPLRSDAARLRMFRRLAWAMWSDDEVASGAPLQALAAL